jgi:glucosamine--fructose-6-phosphate aminotransferase (isomerizing)
LITAYIYSIDPLDAADGKWDYGLLKETFEKNNVKQLVVKEIPKAERGFVVIPGQGNAGKEVAVASTKSFTSQVIILSMIAIWFAQLHNCNCEKRKKYITDLRQLSSDIKTTLNSSVERIQSYVRLFQNKNSCFLLGKGKCEAIAKEGSLKIKELARIHAEGYSTSSLKHGPFALLEPEFPVIMLIPNTIDFSKYDSVYQEVHARQANIICITDKNDFSGSNPIYIPENTTYFELLSIIPLQLLAYYLALDKDINPDMPVNLAKVVTV